MGAKAPSPILRGAQAVGAMNPGPCPEGRQLLGYRTQGT